MAIAPGHKKNFHALRRAFLDGDAALMECQLAATGQEVAVLCAVNRLKDGQCQFVPFATMFPGNPYEAVNPPDGGFYSQEEKTHV